MKIIVVSSKTIYARRISRKMSCWIRGVDHDNSGSSIDHARTNVASTAFLALSRGALVKLKIIRVSSGGTYARRLSRIRSCWRVDVDHDHSLISCM